MEVIDINEEKLAFYSQLGLAITQWSHVEETIAWIVTECLDRQASKVSIDAFFSIENLRSKLRYADTVVLGSASDKTLRTDWIALKDRADGLSQIRNKLAHGTVITYQKAKPGRRFKLLRTLPLKGDSLNDIPGFCLRDIRRHQLEFFALTIGLENFHARLAGRTEPYPESQELPQNPPTLAKLRREIYAFAQRPPRPSRA